MIKFEYLKKILVLFTILSSEVREQPFEFYRGGGQEDLSEPENLFCLFLEQENFFRRPFGPDYFF